MLHTIIGGLIFLVTVTLIMVRPRPVTEAIAAVAGALLMLLCGYVRLGESLTVLRSQWNVYGFFLGLMMISALADQAGVFEVMTNKVTRWALGNKVDLTELQVCSISPDRTPDLRIANARLVSSTDYHAL